MKDILKIAAFAVLLAIPPPIFATDHGEDLVPDEPAAVKTENEMLRDVLNEQTFMLQELRAHIKKLQVTSNCV